MTQPKRRGGRPPLDPSGRPSTSVCLVVTADDYAAVAKLAKVQRTSIQDVIRRGLRRELLDRPKP